MMFLLGLLLLAFFNLSYGLQCINNCSMNYSMSQPFILPTNCSQKTAYRCSVKLLFWYDRRNYTVTFNADSGHENHYAADNRYFIMIETAKDKFFSYEIHHLCKESDDCARLFAEQKIRQMVKRSYNISRIYSDLQRILNDKLALSKNLACFDMNEAVRQCTIPGMSGSCQIIDDLIKHKFYRRLCLDSAQQSASVNIYDSGSFAMMTVKCNRMLCNGPLTITEVKKILAHHNITDDHGRIPGRSTQILLNSYLFILMVISFSFRI